MWGVFTHGMPHTAHPNHLRPIHPQRLYRRSAGRRQTDDLRSVMAPGEMVGPIAQVRMEQRYILLRDCVESC
jgi:hypothetical protein